MHGESPGQRRSDIGLSYVVICFYFPIFSRNCFSCCFAFQFLLFPNFFLIFYFSLVFPHIFSSFCFTLCQFSFLFLFVCVCISFFLLLLSICHLSCYLLCCFIFFFLFVSLLLLHLRYFYELSCALFSYLSFSSSFFSFSSSGGWVTFLEGQYALYCNFSFSILYIFQFSINIFLCPGAQRCLFFLSFSVFLFLIFSLFLYMYLPFYLSVYLPIIFCYSFFLSFHMAGKLNKTPKFRQKCYFPLP